MADKRVIVVGAGHIIGMVKFYLMECGGFSVMEISPSCCEDLAEIIEREQPTTIVMEQSLVHREFLEKLLVLAKEHQLKVVEIYPDDNTIQITNSHKIRLEQAQDFLALL
jgi:hypothetical protein